MAGNTSIASRQLPEAARQVGWRHRILLSRLASLKWGSVTISIKGHGSEIACGSHEGLHATIVIHRYAAFLKALLVSGDLGFAESYLRGDWSSPDLSALLQILSRNLQQIQQVQQRSLPISLWSKIQHALNKNNLTGSRKNIARHYDLGNDFYSRWLDPTMSYSAAVFDEKHTDLRLAQNNKYQKMFDLIDAKAGDHVLEIGCGWGGFAELAASKGVQVTAVTLSKEQYDYTPARIAAKGLQQRVTVKFADYRSIEGQFDHIVSIEMFEAVGRQYWQTYFEQLKKNLKPAGRAALQIITIREDLFEQYVDESGGFIQKYIFPGGMLPTLTHLKELAASNDMHWLENQFYGKDYATTLEYWRKAFMEDSQWMNNHGYDERFQRMWHYYLAFCEAGFRDGRINLAQLCMQKPGA